MAGEDRQHSSALVLFSGGQDSTVCLAWALSRFERVETVGFDYGQRHDIELKCREELLQKLPEMVPLWREGLGPDHMIELPALGKISDSALTRDVEIKMQENGLPNTFVPGRNLLFFTYAAALGYRRDLHALIGGMCETDFSGYPDCRDETLQTLVQAICLGTDTEFSIKTPLMHLTKAQTWELADELGGPPLVDLIIEDTHSCYLGERGTRYDWGHGCGTCPACELRARGFEEWRGAMADATTA